jgi:hypothetical protein
MHKDMIVTYLLPWHESTDRMEAAAVPRWLGADAGMPWLGGMLSYESTGRVGRLRCLDGSKGDAGS